MSNYVSVIALVLAYVALVAAYLALRTLAKLRRAAALLSRGMLTGEGKRSLIEVTQQHAEAAMKASADVQKLREHLDGSISDLRNQVEAMQATLSTQLETADAETRKQVDGVRQQMLDDLTKVEQDIVTRAEQIRTETVAEVARGAAETEGAVRHTALLRYDAFPGMSGRLSFSLALLDETGTGVSISALAGQDDTRVYAKGVAAGRGEHELSPEEAQAVAAALSKTKLRHPDAVRRAS